MASVVTRRGLPRELQELVNRMNLGSADDQETFQYPVYVHSYMHYGANDALARYSNANLSYFR